MPRTAVDLLPHQNELASSLALGKLFKGGGIPTLCNFKGFELQFSAKLIFPRMTVFWCSIYIKTKKNSCSFNFFFFVEIFN